MGNIDQSDELNPFTVEMPRGYKMRFCQVRCRHVRI